MSICARTLYNRSLDRYEGYVDYGKGMEIESTDKLAKEALVFMLVSLRSNWKTPIGYFFVDKIDAEVQSRLVQIALNLSFKYSLEVHSVTCDGTNVNPRTLTLLGCQWLGNTLHSALDSAHMQGREVHLLLDPCHLLKLARNALWKLKVMRCSEGRPICWSHISLLHKIQQEEGLKLANKIGICHIAFQQHVMKVKLLPRHSAAVSLMPLSI